METEMSRLQLVKRSLYAMRNGVVADTLRKAGCPHRIVFGLNLPQIADIAREFGPDNELADTLWADTALRESVLLAPMLYEREDYPEDKSRQMCSQLMWHEDADILCFKLLRYQPYAPQLAEWLCTADSPLMRYAGLRLYFNIVAQHPAEALAAAEAELRRPQPLALANMLAEEARFLMEE